jgi:hypothetical protein
MAEVRKPNTRATSEIAKSPATPKPNKKPRERHENPSRFSLKISFDLKST